MYYSADGYAGTWIGRNMSKMQNLPNTGPIPRGTYSIGAPAARSTGPNSFVLSPDENTSLLISSMNRDPNSFRIHGAGSNNKDASTGCIILPPDRTKIHPGEILNITP